MKTGHSPEAGSRSAQNDRRINHSRRLRLQEAIGVPGSEDGARSTVSKAPRRPLSDPRVETSDVRIKDDPTNSLDGPRRRVRPGPRRPKSTVDMARISRLAQPKFKLTKKSLLQLLPVAHVAYHVLSFLDTASLARASGTCHEMYTLANADILWSERLGDRARLSDLSRTAPSSTTALSTARPVSSRTTPSISSKKGLVIQKSAKQRFVEEVRERSERRAAKLRETFRHIQDRAGVENCLSQTIERLGIALSVTVNDVPCDLLAFRKRSQQGQKEQFRVHSAAPAPNLATGALRFEQVAVLKLAAPADLTESSFFSLCVSCTSKIKSKGEVEVLQWSKAHEQSKVSRLGQSGFLQISLGRSSILFGSLDKGTQRGISLIIVNLHHLDVLASLGIAGFEHTPIVDDLDRNYGLHGYTCSITLRSLGQTWWSANFRDLLSRSGRNNNTAAFTILNADECEGDVTRLIEFKSPGVQSGDLAPSLYFRSETFSGRLDNYVVLDVTVWDEHREAIWAFSRVIPTSSVLASDAVSLTFGDSDHGQGFTLRYEDPDKGCMKISVAHMYNRGNVIRDIHLGLSTEAIAHWFGIS
mmetsp:Transcript_16774/g.32672  ORF Transcript_16774/g.32672 Transcript_16774/m.32672 type:complete len:586 (-) Transcript_16774:96-1853(-)